MLGPPRVCIKDGFLVFPFFGREMYIPSPAKRYRGFRPDAGAVRVLCVRPRPRVALEPRRPPAKRESGALGQNESSFEPRLLSADSTQGENLEKLWLFRRDLLYRRRRRRRRRTTKKDTRHSCGGGGAVQGRKQLSRLLRLARPSISLKSLEIQVFGCKAGTPPYAPRPCRPPRDSRLATDCASKE